MSAKLRKTQLLPPEMAVSLVWGRSNLLSASPEVREIGNEYIDQIRGIKERAKGDPDELRYTEAAMAYMDSTFRNIVTIIRGRNLNFKEAEKLHDNQQKIIDTYKTFSSDLQSLVPRLSGMAIGGVSVSLILDQLIPEFLKNTFGTYTLPIILVFGAASGYIVHAVWIVPKTSQMKEKEKVKTDYDRNLYYDQYIERSKLTLSSLFRRLEYLHQAIFKQKYNDEAKGSKIASELLEGMDSTMCEFVTDCIPRGLVDSDKWSTCETGQNLDKCKIWQEKRV